MNKYFTDFNLVICFIVIFFWTAAILLARRNRQKISAKLLVVPVLFILVGVSINAYRTPWGTYMIALTHVIMLPALFRVARHRP